MQVDEKSDLTINLLKNIVQLTEQAIAVSAAGDNISKKRGRVFGWEEFMALCESIKNKTRSEKIEALNIALQGKRIVLKSDHSYGGEIVKFDEAKNTLFIKVNGLDEIVALPCGIGYLRKQRNKICPSSITFNAWTTSCIPSIINPTKNQSMLTADVYNMVRIVRPRTSIFMIEQTKDANNMYNQSTHSDIDVNNANTEIDKIRQLECEVQNMKKCIEQLRQDIKNNKGCG